jgi:hypothetical protein
LALLAGAAVAQETEGGGPKMVVADKILEFSTVAQGEVIEANFKLVNEGSEPLLVKAVRPTCGCTVAEFDKEIAAEGEGWIKAKLDTSGFSGPITKSILVVTNDPETPSMSLVIKAEVQPYLDVDPRPLVRFSTVQLSEATEKLTVSTAMDQEFRITEVESSVPFVNAAVRKLEASELKAGRNSSQYELTVTMSAEAPVGPVNAQLILHTDHPKAKKVPVRVFGVVRALIHVTPSQIQFGSVEAKVKPGRNVIVVNNQEGKAVKVTGAEVNDPAFAADVLTIEDGQRYQVTVSVQPEADPGSRDAVLSIATTDSEFPQLMVPVRANIK